MEVKPGWQWDLSKDEDWEDVIQTKKDQFVPFPEVSEGRRNFQGTFFRFPLRTASSKMSEVLYSPEDIEKLFETFQVEAERLLLFLASVKEVSLFRRSTDGPSELLFRVEKRVTAELSGGIQSFAIEMQQRGTVMCKSEYAAIHWKPKAVKDKTGEEFSRDLRVVVGELTEAKAKKLAALALELAVRPNAGVAVLLKYKGKPIRRTERSRGLIHCFLPLPPDELNTTGLPFHCHGYFALSENRRSLRFVAGDHRDKKPGWNRLLIGEMLPQAVVHLLAYVRACTECVETAEWMIPDLLPDLSQVKEEWSDLAKNVYRGLENKKVYENIPYYQEYLTTIVCNIIIV